MDTSWPQSPDFWAPAGTDSGKRRKVRADAVLQNLQPDAQRLIVDAAKKPAERDPETGDPMPGTGGVAFVLEGLTRIAPRVSRPELAVSEATLYAFLRWWQLEQDLNSADAVEKQVLAKTGDAKAARQAGEELLIRLGLAQRNPKLIQVATQISDSRRSLDLQEESGKTKARQKDQQLKLAAGQLEVSQRRVTVLEKKLQEVQAEAHNSSISAEEQARRIREILKK